MLPTIAYTGGAVLEYDPKDRFWMRNPYRLGATEYVSPHGKYQLPNQQVTPALSESFSPESEEGVDESSEDELVSQSNSEDEQVSSNHGRSKQTDGSESALSTLSPLETDPRDSNQDLQPMPSSLPDSEFALNCRCGFQGDGNQIYREEEGLAIQCDECKDWSHVACQREGRASNLSRKRMASEGQNESKPFR